MFLMSCRSLAALSGKKEYHAIALKYKQKCIETLRKELGAEAAVSDATVAMVLFLGSDEFHTGNMEGTRSHTEALAKLVHMKGGLKGLGLEGTLEKLIIANDRLSTFYTGSPPNFGPADESMLSAVIDNLTPGFLTAAADGICSNTMLQILDDICAVITSINMFSLQTIPPAVQQDFAIRLLALSSDHRSPSSVIGYSFIEPPLCIAVIVFVGIAFQSWNSDSSQPLLGSAFLAAAIEKLLKQAMATKVTDPLTIQKHAGLFLWIACMGTWAASQDNSTGLVADESLPNRQSMFQDEDMWATLLRVLGIHSLETFKAQLQDFLWVERSCGPFISRMWNNLKTIQL